MLCTLCIYSRDYGLAPTDYESVALDEPTQQPAQPPSTPRQPVAKRDEGIYVTLKWTQPDDDGGTDITGYVIKYREYSWGDAKWTDDDNCSTVDVAGNTTQFQFTDELEMFTRYQFAVAAVNTAGQGQFSLFSDYVNTRDGEHCCD